MMNSSNIIKYPVITEHSADLMMEKKYTFEVDPKANKTEDKTAVEELFNVKVTSDNTMRIKGKFKRMGQYAEYRSDSKKAIVQLSEDSKKLEFLEGKEVKNEGGEIIVN